MFLGVQLAEPGSKYPFDENSESVSNLPLSAIGNSDSKIPCDFFSDVVVDCDDGFDLKLSAIQSHSIQFTWTFGGSSGDFVLTRESFYGTDTAMVVLDNAVVRVRSQLGDDLWRFLDVFNDHSFSASPIGFDPSCFRVREKRLTSFVVNGKSVSGDVLFESGYNAGISLYDQFNTSNAFLIDLSPGSGVGRVPCDDTESGGPLSGLSPDADGSVRIDSDDCYSIIPISSNVLQISGNCSACCSCEGDYLPVAMAVTKLVGRIHNAYGRLKNLIRDYNEFIDNAPDGQADPGSLKVTATASWYPGSGLTDVDISVGIVNLMNSVRVTITGLRLVFKIPVGSSSFTVDFSNSMSSSASVSETKRLIQIDSTVLKQNNAIIPSGGLYIPVGNTMSILSSLVANNSGPGGIAVQNARSVTVVATFNIFKQDSTTETVTQSVVVGRT